MSPDELYALVKELQNSLVEHATNGAISPERYEFLRTSLRRDNVTAGLLPDFVNSCRDRSQFWAFIKGKFRTYAERREYLWAVFRPLLDLLEEAPVAQPTPATFWAPNALKLFISHVSSYKERAQGLKRALNPFAISGFVAHSDIAPTAEWIREIEAGLFTCDALLAVLSPDFHESKWTDQEVGVVFGRGKLIIPVRAGMDPYGFIGQFQGLSVKGRTAIDIVPDILRIIARHAKTRRAYAEALVSTLEEAASWDESKRTMDALEHFTVIDADLKARMKASVDANLEVADAHGVPARIEKLIEATSVPGL